MSRDENIGRKDVSKRVERAHRILDVAAALILRWGYNKTTIDDVAREAGVAKGTIYLHWRTREDLFRALIRRERVDMAEEVKQSISQDPMGATLRGILKHLALVIMKRPLMKALLLRDLDVIGKLAHSGNDTFAYMEKLTGFNSYLETLRDHGLIRADLNLKAQMYIFNAIFMGFFLTMPLMPEGFTLSDDEIADLMAETVHCTLEGNLSISADDLKAVSLAFMQYLDHAVAAAKEHLQQELQ
ncbi:MAG: helix-turn-helix domain containing protein [Desulfosporosinus sp.]|nr:helix-turn-helix domain containing protein [Desulfosporosinus sp.]